jgi:NAD(P)H-dependent FMN reductase
MKIVAFGASNSKSSINKQFATYAANQIESAEITLLDLNDFEMPIYSIDKEKENGIPDLAIEFKQYIKDSDGIIISFAEHNGAYTAAFKNIFDWISRIEKDIWESKPMLLLATSPGGRGASSVLEMAVGKISRMNSAPIAHFSMPNFYENFIDGKVIDSELTNSLKEKINSLVRSIKEAN